MTVKIKFCGITREEDAIAAAAVGADAIGLNFYPSSPRATTLQQAQSIINALPPFITTVGLFVNEDASRVQQVLDQVMLDRLQFHGDETPAYCQQFNKPYIKAIPIDENTDIATACQQYQSAVACLLDTSHPTLKGGTGKVFDWRLVPRDCPCPIILAGGLTPENVGAAIKQVKPYAVDVSSSIEKEPGIKDFAKLQAFAKEVHHV